MKNAKSRVLSLILAVAVLATTLTAGAFTASADAQAGTAFAADWSKWEMTSSWGGSGKANAAEHGYNVLYASTAGSHTEFTYSEALNLGDRFNYGFKVVTQPNWGTYDKFRYAAVIGKLTVTVVGKSTGFTLKADYDGRAVFESDELLDFDDTSALIATVKAAQAAAEGNTNQSQHLTRFVNVSISFDHGVLKLYNAGELYGTTFISGYDFTNTVLKFNPRFSVFSRATVCDISGVKYANEHYVLPALPNERSISFDYSKWTSENGIVATEAANGYDVIYRRSGEAQSSFSYTDSLDFGSEFELKAKVRLGTWEQYAANSSTYISLGDLKVSLVNPAAGRSIKVVVTYGNSVIAESGTWQPNYSAYPDEILAAMHSDMNNAQRLIDLTVSFNNGAISVYDGETLRASGTVSGYDFSAVNPIFGVALESTSVYYRAAFYDLSATVREGNITVVPFGSIAAGDITVEGKGHNAGSAHGDVAGDILYSGMSTAASSVDGSVKRSGETVKVDRFTVSAPTDLGDSFTVRFNYNYKYTTINGSLAMTFILGDLKVDIAAPADVSNGMSFMRVVSVCYGDSELGSATVGYTGTRTTSDEDGILSDMNDAMTAATQNAANHWNAWRYANLGWYMTITVSYSDGILTVKAGDNAICSAEVISSFSAAQARFESYIADDALTHTVTDFDGEKLLIPSLEELNPGKVINTEWVDMGDGYLYRTNKATKRVERKSKAAVFSDNADLSDGFKLNFGLTYDFGKYYSDISVSSAQGEVSFDAVRNIATVAGISPDKLGRSYTAVFTATDNETGEAVSFSKTSSVADYARALYAKTASAELKTLIADMFAYGAAAQVYFGTDTDALISGGSEISASASAAIADDSIVSVANIADGNAGKPVKWHGASVIIGSGTAIRFFVEASADTMATDGLQLNITAGGKSYSVSASEFESVTVDGAPMYAYTFDKLDQTQMDTAVTAQFSSDNSVAMTYSVASYVRSVLDSADSSESLKTLVKLMLTYGRACSAYAESLDVEPSFMHPFASDSIWYTRISDFATYLPTGFEWTYKDSDGKTQSASYGLDEELQRTTTYDDDLVYVFEPRVLQALYAADNSVATMSNDRWTALTQEGLARAVANAGANPIRMYVPAGQFLNETTVNQDKAPNACTAIVQPDGTVYELQPGVRWTDASGNVAGYVCGYAWTGRDDLGRPASNINGTSGSGIEGSHWGSGITALGGSIRVGELTGSGQIEHALKIDIYAARYLYYNNTLRKGFTDPAWLNDSYAPNGGYGGTNTDLLMGSHLAIPKWMTADGLGIQTEVGRKLFYTMQNYGAYIVDDSAWEAYNFCAEYGVAEEVLETYNICIKKGMLYSQTDANIISASNAFAGDMRLIMTNLCIVK